MLVAHLSDDYRVEAADTTDRRIAYYCPECRRPLTLRRGRYKIPHFAHQPYTSPPSRICQHGLGETQQHLAAKRAFVLEFRARGIRAEPEYPLGQQRADVAIFPPNNPSRPVAIELQHTELDIPTLSARVRGYRRRGIPQIWLPLIRPEVFDYTIIPPSDKVPKHYHLMLDPRHLAMQSHYQWEPDDHEFALNCTPNFNIDSSVVQRYSPRRFERWLAKVLDPAPLWFCDPTHLIARPGDFHSIDQKNLPLFSGKLSKSFISVEDYYDQLGNSYVGYSYASKRWRTLDLSPRYPLATLGIKITPTHPFGATLTQLPIPASHIDTHPRP